ncbi:hypothetical protein ACDA63_18495 [Uliginosibacterium sp. sgz301328]|uniref:hypothetical protein n=1 Tax=Uliginosibacterium sp. sgz301328 TaxID=3243764 RepID=UPI00359D206B
MPATTPPRSHFADHAAAAHAVDMVLPAIEAAMKVQRCGDSGCLHIVVMDAARTPAVSSFEEAILYERSLGERDKWDVDYAGLARAKARLSWQHGMDSHAVQTSCAHVLREGDVLLWGGVSLNGIVVAMSGFHPWYDEAFSCAIAACLRALARDTHDRSASRLFVA